MSLSVPPSNSIYSSDVRETWGGGFTQEPPALGDTLHYSRSSSSIMSSRVGRAPAGPLVGTLAGSTPHPACWSLAGGRAPPDTRGARLSGLGAPRRAMLASGLRDIVSMS
mmetsp:Transcript_56056/g.177628  ORF Transcript_56056/g.177628 Transcript_56056/m.177628 type:complete len:110 (+) Transcript_56056:116-445(+)